MSGIYIHIPFCKQACYYCDFHFSTSLKKKNELLNALVKELELRKDEFHDQVVETIYFGGGTPSLLTLEELQTLLDAIYKNYVVCEHPEITLEANPDDLTAHKIMELSQSEINRLSIGIQSFFDDDLKQMNRAHNTNEARNCLEIATKYFDNITIDLIYGIPDMSLEKWNENLKIAFNYGVNHISSYALTVEPKTALSAFIKNGSYPPIDEALALEHFNHLVDETQKHGFVHYEISNFGKPNYFSKHNTSYWKGLAYVGIGPSAHSFKNSKRSWNISNNSKYIQAIHEHRLPNTVEVLSIEDQYNEYVMTGLRTVWGISLNEIEERFGLKFKTHTLDSSEKFIKESLLSLEINDSKTTIRTTKKGKFLIDGIASELFMI
ncbi:coproporphyrinogen III oxidase [Flavobacteriales bacterium 34_180_T64]|nr:coproporphyrinogen III oxidase [Flavobacteriales bacterium 34_180_T64]